MSTLDAEYIAAGAATMTAIWIRNFINDLRIPGCHIDAVPLSIDNNNALKLTRNPEFHNKSKHIEIKHHFIREKVMKNKIIDTRRVDTKDNIADILTKTLARPTHDTLVKKSGISRGSPQDSGEHVAFMVELSYPDKREKLKRVLDVRKAREATKAADKEKSRGGHEAECAAAIGQRIDGLGVSRRLAVRPRAASTRGYGGSRYASSGLFRHGCATGP